jgi:hypothetical protein
VRAEGALRSGRRRGGVSGAASGGRGGGPRSGGRAVSLLLSRRCAKAFACQVALEQPAARMGLVVVLRLHPCRSHHNRRGFCYVLTQRPTCGLWWAGRAPSLSFRGCSALKNPR